ncbi:MAG: hypothetical protein ACPL7G_02880 [Chloroflexia bacterium]
MFCSRCGARNPQQNIVCRSCGAWLEERALDGAGAAAYPPVESPISANPAVGRAAVFGLMAAAISSGIWFILEQWAHQPLPLGTLVALLVPEAVLRGAGQKRTRALPWISLGLTLLATVVMIPVLAAADPAGFPLGLARRLQGPLVLFHLWGLSMAYLIPAPYNVRAPKKAEEKRRPSRESGPPVLRCIRCQVPTTEEEAQPLPGQWEGNRVAVLCPRCFAEIEATRLFPR